MAGRERSKGGCWTCKLRKKKCDETRPSCAGCLSLGIDCHGYGPKPAWMDGGSAEKARLEGWRQRVKEVTNHKRRLRYRQHEPQSPQISNLSENDGTPLTPAFEVVSAPSLHHLDERYSPFVSEAHSASRILGQEETSSGENRSSGLQLPTPSTSDLDQEDASRPLPALREEEADLLMHYLDNVFPLQFPFFKHSAIKGSRGWLLSLLMRLEPLYHAACSVSAYHMHFEELAQEYELHYGTIENVKDFPTCCKLQDQLVEHNLTLSRLSKMLDRLGDLESNRPNLQLPEYIDLIACMATLISLEVLKGSSDSWRIHLDAATYLLPLAHEAFQSGHAKDLSNTHKEAYRFFSTAFVWYKFQSCAATGNMLDPPCEDFELSNLHMPMSQFTGCEEWITDELLKIMKLAHWKDTMKEKKQLSVRELTTRALEIDRKLKSEMIRLSARLEATSHHNFFENPDGYIKLLVTRLFGFSTLIYLYTIESGHCPDVPEIHDNVSKTIDAFKALPQPELIRSLSWPLCIAGSMATEDQQAAFLEITTKAKIHRYPFGSSNHALAIIQECWRMRDDENLADGNVDWMVAMRNLGLNVLLA